MTVTIRRKITTPYPAPHDNTVIFSAHGVSQKVRREAERRKLRVFDATCPLVTKVHLEVARHCRDGHEVILIGHRGHPEAEGTMGQCFRADQASRIHLVETAADVVQLDIGRPEKIAFVTQTTLAMDDTKQVIDILQERFPNITGPKKNDICYATQNRQDAVKDLASRSVLVLVVGSTNSSNSNHLHEIAEKQHTPAHLIDGAEDIQGSWLTNIQTVGVTAGASAPEMLVEEVIERLKAAGAKTIDALSGREEKVTFSLPKTLQP